MARLLKMLSRDKNLRIEIETNGGVSLEKFVGIGDNITFTMDYKLPGSGMDKYMIMENYNLLRHEDTVKFVVSDRNDMDRARKIIDEYQLTKKTEVYLSSSFNKIMPKDIVEYMIEHNMNKVKLQLQMHKYIWEPDRKGV